MNRSPSPWGNRQTAPDLQPLVTVCNDSFRRAFAYSLDYLTGHHKSLVYLPPPAAAALLTNADHLAYPVNKLSSSLAAASFATSAADQFVLTNALVLVLALVYDFLVLAHDSTHTPTQSESPPAEISRKSRPPCLRCMGSSRHTTPAPQDCIPHCHTPATTASPIRTAALFSRIDLNRVGRVPPGLSHTSRMLALRSRPST